MHTSLIRVLSFLMGVLLNYAYLLLIGKVTSDNLIFIIIFGLPFMWAVTELVAEYKLCVSASNRSSSTLAKIRGRKQR